MTPKIEIFMKCQVWWNFRKSDLSERFAHFGRPCRGLSPGKGFAPNRISHMTRRAFLSSRVIQAQGESRSRWLVKKWCKWLRQMKISQNLWIQLTPEQFAPLDQTMSYPGMYLLCLSMRFRKKSCRIGFCVTPKNLDFHEFLIFLENDQRLLRKLLGHVWSLLECIRASGSDSEVTFWC